MTGQTPRAMRKSHQLILFLKSFATGIMVPVMTLVLLAHGASIRTISLLLGVYSGVVILAEFPTGLFADLYGRKKAFVLSAVFQLLSLGVILLSRSNALLLFAMILFGLGRAFASGSIDALVIDDAVDHGSILARVTARLSILESAGLATGALAGGFLAGTLARYEGNIVVYLSIYTLVLLLTVLYVHENLRRAEDVTQSSWQRTREQIKESFAFLSRKGTVRMLVVLTAVTGFAMLSLETYWQPALASISSDARWLGVVSVVGFLCVIGGSTLSERMLVKRPGSGIALALGLKAIMGGVLVLLAFQTRLGTFASVYALVYLFLGSGGVAENTLLNQEAPPAQRASILSLFSFILQVGALLASLCGYVVSANTDYKVMWLLAGGLLVLLSGLLALRRPSDPLP